MASHEVFYTSRRPLWQTHYQNIVPSPTSNTPPPTPPPPPPKPSSQDLSRIGTPQASDGPPPPPPQASKQATDSPVSQPPLPQPPFHTHTPLTHSIPPPIPPPPLEAHWLPETLPSKTTTDLALILQNPKLLSALSSTHPSHASSLQLLQTALTANIDLASHVLEKQTQLSALRAATQQLLLQHSTLSTQWRRKQSEVDSALAPWGPRAMYHRLVASIQEQEALLKALQESFLEGEGGEFDTGSVGGKASEKEVNEWIRRIRDGTVVLERRREARARWDEGRVGGWR